MQIGLCDNANSLETTLSPNLVTTLRPHWRRSIAYWDDGEAKPRWQRVINSAKLLKGLGVGTLVVFNTEASGTDVNDVETHVARLDEFLRRADGAIDAVEPGNELDTPAWRIPDDLIIRVGRRAADICHARSVRCISPSFLTGPTEGRFEACARGLTGFVDGMGLHPYYCSIDGWPTDGWYFGTVEQKCDEALARSYGLPVWLTELGCPVGMDGIGEQAQANFVRALCSFDHPGIEMACYFTLFRGCVPGGEMAEGKDWYLFDERSGRHRPAFDAFDGGLQMAGFELPPVQSKGFEEGFRIAHDADPGLVGEPAEYAEFGPRGTKGLSDFWTTKGVMTWAGPRVPEIVGGSPEECDQVLWFRRFSDLARFVWRGDHWEAA